MDVYGDSVYRFCRSLTFSKEDAEDLFQETFLRALLQPDKLTALENPKSFLFSTALFLWKDWKRKYARRQRIAPLTELTEAVSAADNLDDTIISQEEARIVREIVDALPEKFKIPTILYYTSELPVPDIARALQIPVGTVKSRLFKARKLVEKELLYYEK